MEAVNRRGGFASDSAESIKKGLHLMVVAMKNLALYPVDSQANRLTLGQLLAWFQEYFALVPVLTLIVAKDGLATEDEEVVYREKPTEPIVCAPMFREGLQALIFENGLTEAELKDFLLILNKFRNPSENEMEDLVTAMWQASFRHVKYQVADEYVEVDPEFDTNAMRAARARLDLDGRETGLEALRPQEVDGTAPVAKSLNSLFALVQDPAILSAAVSKRVGDGDEEESTGLDPSPDDLKPNLIGEPSPGGEALTEPKGGSDPELLSPSEAFTENGQSNPYGGPASSSSSESKPEGQPNYGPGGEIVEDPSGYVDPDLNNLAQAFAEMSQKGAKGQSASGTPNAHLAHENSENRLNYWGLTDDEAQRLAALVKWDESVDIGYQALDVLLIVIVSPVVTPKVAASINVFLAEEARRSFVELDLKNFNYFFDRLRQASLSSPFSHVKEIFDDLKNSLSNPEIVSALLSSTHPPEKIQANYDDLRYFLYQLPVETVKALAMGLNKLQNQRLKNLILEVMAYAYAVASSDENFGPILSALNESAIVALLKILVVPGRPFPAHILTALTKHSSAVVRSTAAKEMLERDPTLLAQIPHLAADPLVTVALRPFLAKASEPIVEKYLLKYLRDNYEDPKTQANYGLTECYQTLGRCASSASLPFLSEVLLKSGLKNLVTRSLDPHRLGAALALFQMTKNADAEEILKKASRSAFRTVRAAFQEAKKRLASSQT
ncbi:MAG: hypothetical protein LBE01_04195 [Deltaproteobacteria bacterium]|nr:hypothetical protein [Deltaproteobacteria bacterium]